MKKSRISLILASCIILIFAFSPVAIAKRNLSSNIEAALKSINTEEGLSIISELASDKYEGRLTGTPGDALTARFVSGEFAKAGLKPFGEKDTYFQKFQLPTNKILPTPILEVQTGDAQTINYEFGRHFICAAFSGSGDFRSDVVFCGYGITSSKYDDYAGMDVKGKIIMLMAGHPNSRPDLAEWDTSGRKVRNAIDHGVVAILSIRSNTSGVYEKPICSAYWGDIPHQTSFPIIVISKLVALDLFEKSRQDLPILQKLIDTEKRPMSFDTGTFAHVRVEAEFTPLSDTANIVGLIEGSDPRLKNEYIVIGAHLDHVGLQGTDILFPGSNDNASGVAGLIEIARAFKESGSKPKRSIIFAAFTGEEMGLKGSGYFVKNPPVDKKRIKAMINLDMIGEGNSTLLCFGKGFPKMVQTAQKANVFLYRMNMPVIETGTGSDHASFVKAGIPAMMFLNGGEYDYPDHHQHYHYREWMMNMGLWKKTTETALLSLWLLAN